MKGQTIFIDVLSNDSFGAKVPAINSHSNTKNGRLTLKGFQFIYTPNKNFSGKDQFFYQLKNQNGKISTGHVLIHVIGPAQTKSTDAISLTKIKTIANNNSNNKKPRLETKKPNATSAPSKKSLSNPVPAKNTHLFDPNGPIKNPYYSKPLWKLWFQDQQAVDGHKAVSLFNRHYPIPQPPGSEIFLAYSNTITATEYAGFWDDFYLNQDNNHSRLNYGWDDGKGNQVINIRHKIMRATTGTFDSSNLKKWGVTYTSQSTTHMGHDIANRLSRMHETETLYYFSNVLRLGPAYISFRDVREKRSTDRFQALSPIMLNSYGKSGSEMNAITKLLLASGYLPKTTKYQLKYHGVYASALLYIWKAGLPFKVPYNNELRHRVAYLTRPRAGKSKNGAEGLLYLKYDEVQHMKNMVNIAKNMIVAPPIALIKKIDIQGGKAIYDQLKTTWLIHQNEEPVTLKVSLQESYDLQDLPLSFQWTVLYGNKKTKIVQLDQNNYKITVPYDAKLPGGRTAVMLTANNGYFDSNPAIINIHRVSGKNNFRPSLEGFTNRTVKPGERVEFDIKSIDPEGYPTTLYQWGNEEGHIEDKRFIWDVPLDTPPGRYPITIISSDGTTGASYNAQRFYITVQDK